MVFPRRAGGRREGRDPGGRGRSRSRGRRGAGAGEGYVVAVGAGQVVNLVRPAAVAVGNQEKGGVAARVAGEALRVALLDFLQLVVQRYEIAVVAHYGDKIGEAGEQSVQGVQDEGDVGGVFFGQAGIALHRVNFHFRGDDLEGAAGLVSEQIFDDRLPVMFLVGVHIQGHQGHFGQVGRPCRQRLLQDAGLFGHGAAPVLGIGVEGGSV